MTLPALIARLTELEKKASAGPLHVERRDSECGSIDYIVHSEKDFAWCKDGLDRKAKFNAQLIAETRSALPTLLEALAIQREALEFYANDFTWARVSADARHCGMLGEFNFNGMYGDKARYALARVDALAGKLGGEG